MNTIQKYPTLKKFNNSSFIHNIGAYLFPKFRHKFLSRPKAPVTLSRNEREPAGITIFKIRDTFGRDSHLLKK